MDIGSPLRRSGSIFLLLGRGRFSTRGTAIRIWPEQDGMIEILGIDLIQ